MGNGASAGRPGGVGRRGADRAATRPDELPAYPVKPISANLSSLPFDVLLRVDPEALQLVHAGTQAVVRSYPLYAIPCWGFTRSTFQFRAFVPVRADGGSVETFEFETPKGEELEGVVMATVRELMRNMKARGVPDAQFQQLVSVLREEAVGAIESVRQVAMTHEFDVKQACRLVTLVGNVSPFDKAEAAVCMYPTLFNKDSFTLVLDLFDDAADRANICHRLGLTVDSTGAIVEHGRRNAAREPQKPRSRPPAADGPSRASGSGSGSSGSSGSVTAPDGASSQSSASADADAGAAATPAATL